MPDQRALLEVAGLCSGYQGSTVLHGLDLKVCEGEVYGLLGRNGVGKSTLAMTIMGIVQRSAGTLTFAGRDLTRLRQDLIARAGLGLVPQGRRVFASLTVDEHLRISGRKRSSGPWTVDAVYDLLPRLAERARHHGNQLSGGEQQMLAIGRALLGNPQLLILDEPSDGLAPAIVRQVTEVVQMLSETGVSILLVEQDMATALALANRVGVMEKGRIVVEDDAAAFRAQPDRLASLLSV